MTKKQKSENESTKKTHSLFNRPFVRFLSLLLTVLIIIPLTAAAVVFTPDVYGDTFLGALAPKLQWLRTAKEKRIIVVGGSSVAFGLDSPMLKQYTGYEVVNFGLYATLGTRIMLDLSEDYIREGDIVILAPEIDSQTLSMYYNAEAVWQAAGSDLSVLSKIHFDNYLETIAQIPEYLSDSLTRLFDGSGKISPTGIYRKDSFNEEKLPQPRRSQLSPDIAPQENLPRCPLDPAHPPPLQVPRPHFPICPCGNLYPSPG